MSLSTYKDTRNLGCDLHVSVRYTHMLLTVLFIFAKAKVLHHWITVDSVGDSTFSVCIRHAGALNMYWVQIRDCGELWEFSSSSGHMPVDYSLVAVIGDLWVCWSLPSFKDFVHRLLHKMSDLMKCQMNMGRCKGFGPHSQVSMHVHLLVLHALGTLDFIQYYGW